MGKISGIITSLIAIGIIGFIIYYCCLRKKGRNGDWRSRLPAIFQTNQDINNHVQTDHNATTGPNNYPQPQHQQFQQSHPHQQGPYPPNPQITYPIQNNPQITYPNHSMPMPNFQQQAPPNMYNPNYPSAPLDTDLPPPYNAITSGPGYPLK